MRGLAFLSGMMLAMALGPVSAVAQLAPALPNAPAAPVASVEWQRFLTLDGGVAVHAPCKTEEATILNANGSFAVLCKKDGLVYAAVVGHVSQRRDELLGDYEPALAYAHGESSADVVEMTLQGHRAFHLTVKSPKKIALSEVVDFQPGRPITMAVYTDPKSKIAADDLAAARSRGEQFFNSLEILAK